MDYIAERILAGEPLDGIRVIDAHGHYSNGMAWYIKDHSPQETIRQMDRCGVDLICMSSILAVWNEAPAGNEQMCKVVENSCGRIKGYFVVNGNCPDELEAEIYKYKDTPGFIGAKVYSGTGLDSPNPNIALDDSGLDRLYELADKFNFCILAHTWGSGSYPAAPGRFRKALEKNPGLKILVGHAGGDYYGHRETIELIRDYPNVYYDITGTEFGHIWIKDLVRSTDHGRIVFGSDLGVMDLRHYIGMVGLADIDTDIKLDIFGRNMDRLLQGLSHQ